MEQQSPSPAEAPTLRDPRLRLSVTAVLLWGMAAHGFAFANGLFAHDTLNALIVSAAEENLKLQLGRFLVPLYRALIRPGVAMPWLIGLISLLFLGLAAYATVRLLDLRAPLAVILTAGVFAVNLTVTSGVAAYAHELDMDMLALLLSALAALCWRERRRGWLWGAVPLAASLGLYQAYFAVTTALLMLSSIQSLLDGDGFREVWRRGLLGIAMLALGGLLYAAALRVVAAATGTALSSAKNSVSALWSSSLLELPRLAVLAYGSWGLNMLRRVPVYPMAAEAVINAALLILSLVILVRAIRRRRLDRASAALVLALDVLLPLGTNLLYVLSRGHVHDLMRFPFVLVYVLVISLAFRYGGEAPRGQWERAAAGILIAVLLWGGIVSANMIYTKRELEKSETLSYMTRVLDRIESTSGYIVNETPLAIYGNFQYQPVTPGFEDVLYVSGVNWSSWITNTWPNENFHIYEAYFHYILNRDVVICGDADWYRLREEGVVDAMPCFPDPGCIQMADGILVVKLGDN